MPPRVRFSRFALIAALAVLLEGCATVSERPAVALAAEGRPLRVVSFNIHLGEALEKERSGGHGSMARVFGSEPLLQGTDILGLQEVCADEGGWQLDYLRRMVGAPAGRTGMATALSDPSGGFECERVEAIISRHPVVASGAITLPQVFEPRSAVWADIEIDAEKGTPSTVVRVYNAHLENRPQGMSWTEGRRRQIEVVLAHLEAWRAEHPGAPVILLGDLNTNGHGWDFWRSEPTLFEIARHRLEPSLRKRHRTLTQLPHELDWIFFDGFLLRRSSVVHVLLSDHFPVVADLLLARRDGTARSSSLAVNPSRRAPE